MEFDILRSGAPGSIWAVLEDDSPNAGEAGFGACLRWAACVTVRGLACSLQCACDVFAAFLRKGFVILGVGGEEFCVIVILNSIGVVDLVFNLVIDLLKQVHSRLLVLVVAVQEAYTHSWIDHGFEIR